MISVVIGEVTSLQLTPSLVDLRIFPPTPTATNVLLPKATPLSSLVIGVLLEVQLLPLEEVMIFPELPTATNVLFPKVTPQRVSEVPEDELLQDAPLFVDLTIVPLLPTATKVPFPKLTPLR